MNSMWKIWFEVFDSAGAKVGAGVSCTDYAYKQNAVRAARRIYNRDCFKWIISKTNPFVERSEV